MRDLDRVAVVGTSCVGKTTLARDLAMAFGTAHYELDRLWWLPGWDHREDDEFHALVDEATSAPRWVVDGNYEPVPRDDLGARDVGHLAQLLVRSSAPPRVSSGAPRSATATACP